MSPFPFLHQTAVIMIMGCRCGHVPTAAGAGVGVGMPFVRMPAHACEYTCPCAGCLTCTTPPTPHVHVLRNPAGNHAARAALRPRACTRAQVTALEQLYNLNALDEEGMLTKLGRKMAEFPLEPPMSKVGAGRRVGWGAVYEHTAIWPLSGW